MAYRQAAAIPDLKASKLGAVTRLPGSWFQMAAAVGKNDVFIDWVLQYCGM